MEDNNLLSIHLKLVDDKVYVEMQKDKFASMLYTPLKKKDIDDKNIFELSEQIRFDLINAFL